ncbi:MAG: hypothetical protein ACI9QC_000254 [Oceanicoccus sp.]|jgi:hypothetical protein
MYKQFKFRALRSIALHDSIKKDPPFRPGLFFFIILEPYQSVAQQQVVHLRGI